MTPLSQNAIDVVFTTVRFAARAFFAAVFILVGGLFVVAQEQPERQIATLEAQSFNIYGRLILSFPERLDLPAYSVKSENGVLALEFDERLDVSLPDISGILPAYVSVARLDPDGRGIRLGLKRDLRINRMEAGEKLFIDLLPPDWSGMPPSLPAQVVTELAQRSQRAAVEAERRRMAELARLNKPAIEVRVGRHPTFVRLMFDWSLDAEAEFRFDKNLGTIEFDWPVPIDLYPLKTDLPEEILSASNTVTQDGSRVLLGLADGVTPRFYELSPREFVVDFDRLNPQSDAVDLVSLLPETETLSVGITEEQRKVIAGTEAAAAPVSKQVSLKPRVSSVGSTVRMVFPFEDETSAAVFRRGDTVWMIFDTQVAIGEPEESPELARVADEFTVVPTSGASIVRMKLTEDRLATLGSEGRSWVLSLGDLLIGPTEPITLTRRQTREGLFEVAADVRRPVQVHELRDPDVGDVLEVVTAFPPARGMIRDLEHVDFTALRSVHGLVVKPQHNDLYVRIEDASAVIGAERGLILSSPKGARGSDAARLASKRDGFMDLNAYVEPDPDALHSRREELMTRAASGEEATRDAARLELARLYLANQLSYEALGVTEILVNELSADELAEDALITRAAAAVAAGRSQDALAILNTQNMSELADGLMWRSIAKAQMRDFKGARADALAAEPVVDAYPSWVQSLFRFSAVEAGLEEKDLALATRFLAEVDTGALNRDQLSLYELLSGRVDEAAGRFDDALDTYGRVIAADIRPTHAEAVYRTLRVLDRMGRLDSLRGAETLASEVIVWRGDDLEAQMQAYLADLRFRVGDYRVGFETVRQAAGVYKDNPLITDLVDKATKVFADLYLNGQADAMEPIDALALYYDFRQLTPAGARGDEMIRNLARRLIRVDLLDQAAELLEYQIENRLEGAARAQIAADLAVIHIANRQPDKALKVLASTRLAGLPPALARQRRILEARSLVDAGREDLALDILDRMDGRDADLLRVDAHWRSKRYGPAAELLEQLYTPVGSDAPLTPQARNNLVRAAVGFVLANDKIGLSRLRSRYEQKMAQSPEWPLFEFVTGQIEPTNLEFRQVARDVAAVDSLNAFLTTYRETYEPDGALAPEDAVPPTAG